MLRHPARAAREKSVVVAVSLALVLAVPACGDDPLPDAADGTNLEACSDGDCEVLVNSGDVFDIAGFGPVEVAVEDDKVEVASRSDDGQGNTSSMSAGGVAGQRLVLNDQEFTVVAVQGEQGVLRVGS